jgi:hypothetical protein
MIVFRLYPQNEPFWKLRIESNTIFSDVNMGLIPNFLHQDK